MTVMDMDLARYNMIEQQIRPWDVLDPFVLEVLAETPRERFVPKQYLHLAFTDTQIPLLHDQKMLEPKMEGRILQSLQIKPTDEILEIGTGSGYLTACLAKLGKKVTSVDIFPEFIQQAEQQVAGLGLENIQFEVADASKGWTGDNPFDVVVVSASLPILNPVFQQSLALKGRQFVVVGNHLLMEALLIQRVSDQEWATESLFETNIPAMLHADKPPAFVF
jgi:protein-L-isoaspartate(D-aspartate) O-methyltransferase